MSEAKEVTVLNLHEYLRYDLTNVTGRVTIMWDGSNRTVNSLIMKDTFIKNDDYYANALWVNVVKQLLNWEKGTILNISVQEFHDLHKIIIHQPMYLSMKPVNFRIDEDGYLFMNRVNAPNNEMYTKCSCLYNDLLDEENYPYLLK